MNFEPVVSSVPGTQVVHEGVPLVVVTVNDRAHVVDRAVFDLLFRPIVSPAETIAMMEAPAALNALQRIGGEATAIAARVADALELPKPKAKKPRKIKRSATKSAATRTSAEPQASFSEYPVSLRDPRADTQRAAYDTLQKGQLSLGDITARMKQDGMAIEGGAVFAALAKLREKGLAKKLDGNGDWILC